MAAELEGLLRTPNAGLYEAKNSGRRQIAVSMPSQELFAKPSQSPNRRRLSWAGWPSKSDARQTAMIDPRLSRSKQCHSKITRHMATRQG
jgi:hypothetical protein